MNIIASKRGNTAAFPLKPVAAGCAVFLTILAAGAANAQTAEAPAEGMQSVTVTGIRSGIEAAISIKKNSTSIVEAISAEDIGKLPDSSVAESIARLPGVLDALEADHDYLTEGDVFTTDLIETWIDYKRKNEIAPIALRPHPHEFELYFDI